MAALTRIVSRSVVLRQTNIDTDQIIPARFLTTTSREGLGRFAFNDWRYREDGSPDPAFALNAPEAQGAQILVTGRNFGCGSSREHAPWALLDYGIRVVISTRIADIFRNNALMNGVLPLVVSEQDWQCIAAFQAQKIVVDLDALQIQLPDGSAIAFQVDAFARECLLKGVDQLGYLLLQENAIDAFERNRAA